MSSRGNLHPWFVVGIGGLLFAILPLVRKAEGVKERSYPLEGAWVGPITCNIQDPKFWEGVSGPHRDAVLYFNLEWNTQWNENGGDGEIHFLGAQGRRKIHIGRLHLQQNGPIDLRFSMPEALYLSFDGKVQGEKMTWQSGNSDEPTMTANLSRGDLSVLRHRLDENAVKTSDPGHEVGAKQQ